jgi:glycosyltransferase involved in cell wall biosynthesis
MKNRISVAIAVYNEEKSIGSCLQSVNGWVEEIIVVDGSSSDNTVKIAEKYGAKVMVTDNPENFHINKQKAIDLCKGDWILQLDADEVVSEELKNEMLSVVSDQLSVKENNQTFKINHQPLIINHFNGYFIPRKNYFLGKFLEKGGQYPDYTLRLYKRGKGKLPCKDIHEQAVVSGVVGTLKNPLLHYSYPDFKHYLDHFNLYTDFSAQEMKKSGISQGFNSYILYMFIRPFYWFILSYIRHKGFVDGFAGFVFSLFSALRFPVSFIKYYESKKDKKG